MKICIGRHPVLSWAIAEAALLIFISCQSPLPPPDTSFDYTEFESVWQYLKAYSIYQDRIPPDPFVYRSPAALLASIGDTLGGHDYTAYTSDKIQVSLSAVAFPGVSAHLSLAPGLNSTVFLDTLTDSVALLTIWTFDSATVYSDFLYCTSEASRFPNIIINLRNNRGGYIDQADSIIAALVPSGTPYIQARQRDYDNSAKKFITLDWHQWVTQYGPRQEFQGKHFAVLMDTMTASASELLVSALYEGKAAHLIGTRSYGKGMGQVEIIRRRDITYNPPFIDRRMLQITFLQLKGVSQRVGDYHRTGIQPDTIPQAVQNMASAASLSDWHSQVFYAVRMLDSAATPASISYPPERDTLGLHKQAGSGLLKVIYEE
jgi:hypothetical protein